MEKIFTQKKRTQTFKDQPSAKTINAIMAYASATAVIRGNSTTFCVSNN